MKTKPKQWFSASEAARSLGLSVDKVRQLDQSGELPAERTKGGHRRFSRKALDAYPARIDRRTKPKVQRASPRPRPVTRPEPEPEPFDENVDVFEADDDDFEPFV